MNILEYENYQEKKSHSTNNFQYNTYICTIPLDFKEVPNHWHEEVEFIIIKKGTGIIEVNFKYYTAIEGDIFFILPGQIHSILQKESNTMEYENIIFRHEILGQTYSEKIDNHLFNNLINSHYYAPIIFSKSDSNYEEISTHIASMEEITKTYPLYYELLIKGHILFIFYLVLNLQTIEKVSKTYSVSTLNRTRKIVSYIEKNYINRVTIDAISEYTNLSKSHFMKFFQATFKMTFTSYLNNYRLNMVSRLLKVSDASISNIAYECGFDNLSYFNRLFKKKYNLTPRQYRKNLS